MLVSQMLVLLLVGPPLSMYPLCFLIVIELLKPFFSRRINVANLELLFRALFLILINSTRC